MLLIERTFLQWRSGLFSAEASRRGRQVGRFRPAYYGWRESTSSYCHDVPSSDASANIVIRMCSSMAISTFSRYVLSCICILPGIRSISKAGK